jgi:intracellular sulfur oxidation DsrE/DsrF family protein
MKRSEKIEKFFREEIKMNNLDIMYHVDADEVNSFDDVYEAIENDRGFEVEIIYYTNAMEYLMERDPSLRESLEIAEEYGYTPSNITSEVLASLLASKECREEFMEYENMITEFFNSLDEEDEQE